MADSYVDFQDVQVMRVRADLKGKGPPEAFNQLESKLPTLRGRKFYGSYRRTPQGEEYYACVARVESDNPEAMGLETGTLPGGRYARRKVVDWERVIAEGRLPGIIAEAIEAHGEELDPGRFCLEFYRSQDEMVLLVPVRASPSGP
jgi:hypothetical protein